MKKIICFLTHKMDVFIRNNNLYCRKCGCNIHRGTKLFLVLIAVVVIGCAKTTLMSPNQCAYILENGMKVYEQKCDPDNMRNVGEPVCVEGNVIVPCSPGRKQHLIKEVLR